LFFRSDALTRQLSAPLVEERRQYLAECASQGMSRRSLRDKSPLIVNRRASEIGPSAQRPH
jgi:hypothetical protein